MNRTTDFPGSLTIGADCFDDRAQLSRQYKGLSALALYLAQKAELLMDPACESWDEGLNRSKIFILDMQRYTRSFFKILVYDYR